MSFLFEETIYFVDIILTVKMGCNCGKKKIGTQPKKIVKSPSQRIVGGGGYGTVIKRIIRRAK